MKGDRSFNVSYNWRFKQSILLILLCFVLHASAWLQMIPYNFNGLGAYSEHYNGNGCSFVDFNLDGWDDVTFGTPNGIVFLQNDQNGDFDLVDLGIENSGDARHPMWVDIDNDGDLDFFTTNCLSPCRLWLNQGENGFVDISTSCGIEQSILWESHGASWGDFNGDGFLDVYINNYNKEGLITNYFYVNNGDQTFTDLTASCNCDNGSQESFQSLWFDFNQDGLQDLAVINDRLLFANALYINQGDSTFEDVATDVNFDLAIYAMTLSLSDYDNDDDDDFYVTNSVDDNVFLENQAGSFVDIAQSMNMTINQVCWGAQWFDYDNDADEDLFVGTFNNVNEVPNFFFLNANGSFESQPEIINYNASDVHASAAGDFNNDGFTDILLHTFEENFRILTNFPNGNNWIKINLEGTISNAFGVGAELRIFTNGQLQKRTVFCGEDYMGQDSYTELFGVGAYQLIDSLSINWPSGWTDTFFELNVNELVTLTEGSTFQPELSLNGSGCANDSNYLDVTVPSNLTYTWFDNSTDSLLYITESGNYSVVVTNGFGITSTISQDVVLNDSPELLITIDEVACNGGTNGSIELVNTSTTPLTSIEWNNGLMSGSSISDLPAGTYSYAVVDENGCTVQDTVLLVAPTPLELNLEIQLPLCFDELASAEVNPSGGVGDYTIVWSTEDPAALVDGNYTVDVTDSNGCGVFDLFSITIPTELLGTLSLTDADNGNNGSAEIAVSGGTPPYFIQWSNSAIGESTSDLGQGTYVVFVSDNNGCTWSESFSIVDTNVPELANQINLWALGNGHFSIASSKPIVQIDIYDYTGKRIETIARDAILDSISIEQVPQGIYIFVFTFEDDSVSKVAAFKD